MRKIISFGLGCLLILGISACSEQAKTSQKGPDSPDQLGQMPDAQTRLDSQDDATSQVRQDQLSADIRAREQRNDMSGGDDQRAAGDLTSEVRSKLEANLPASQLTVDIEDAQAGIITVAGTVPTQAQLNKIEPLAKEIKGIQVVNVNVKVTPS